MYQITLIGDFMKNILLVLSVLISFSALAQAIPYPGQPYPGNGPGYLRPGDPAPGQPYPGNPGGYPQRPPPGYNDVYGPARTVRWYDVGSHRADKFLDRDVVIDVNGALVNELYLVASNNRVAINSAVAYLMDGQVVDLRGVVGEIRDGQQVRSQLDYRFSLRVRQIVLNIESPNLIGSRGNLNIHLGLAQ
jgi:hypothetical protein